MATPAQAPPVWADSKDAWLSRVHDAVLPSGTKVTYRDLSLAELALLGELPGDLLELVISEWADPGSAGDLIKAPLEALPAKPTRKQRETAETESRKILAQLAAVNRHLIAAALVQPQMTVAELEHVPMPDLEMLSALINRSTAIDSAGRRVGVVPVDQFQVVLAAHGHQPCPADCPSCEEARRSLSTLR